MTTKTANTDDGKELSDDVSQDDATPSNTSDSIGMESVEGGDEAVDSPEAEAALMAGWKKAGRSADDEEQGKTVKKTARNEADELQPTTDDQTAGAPANDAVDDPEVPGLGMKASQVKARLDSLDRLEKSLNSTAGHLGHLKQLVSQAGKGKPITKESLSTVAEQFGEEYAEALAADLNRAGFGAGSALDGAAVQQMVEEQLTVARERSERDVNKRLVKFKHPDADEHFAQPVIGADGQQEVDDAGNPKWKSGSKHAQFMQFVGTLPKERQQQLASTWDAEVIAQALDEFKAHMGKVANTQTRQAARISRAVAPTTSSGRADVPPATDPLVEGWNRAKGVTRRGAVRA